MFKSFNATATVSVSAIPVVVDIAIPVEKLIPAGYDTFAPDKGGITTEK
jgi:hypothetical protein